MSAIMVLGLILSLFLSIFVSVPVICSLYSVFDIDFITVYFYTLLQRSYSFSFGNNCPLLSKFYKIIFCFCYPFYKLGLFCIFNVSLPVGHQLYVYTVTQVCSVPLQYIGECLYAVS